MLTDSVELLLGLERMNLALTTEGVLSVMTGEIVLDQAMAWASRSEIPSWPLSKRGIRSGISLSGLTVALVYSCVLSVFEYWI